VTSYFEHFLLLRFAVHGFSHWLLEIAWTARLPAGKSHRVVPIDVYNAGLIAKSVHW
jgi:hypothetical protein